MQWLPFAGSIQQLLQLVSLRTPPCLHKTISRIKKRDNTAKQIQTQHAFDDAKIVTRAIKLCKWDFDEGWRNVLHFMGQYFSQALTDNA